LNKYSSDNIKIISWLENLSKAIDRCGNIENREKFLSEEQKNLSVFKRGVYLKDYLSKKKDQHLKIQDIDFAFPSLSGQLNANDFSKFKEFKLKKNINASQPVFKKDLIITDSREFIEIIRDKISNLILRSGVIVNKNCKLEISHHYGLDKFYKFGLTMITIFNSGYCKKLLFLFYNQKHPPQYHKEKQETFFILSGKVRVLIVKKNRTKNIILKTGDIMTIYPNELHSFQSISREGSIIEELSTTSKKDDSFYSDNLINSNKNRKSFISLN
jgi:D-lyxose ketol-isomerase